MAPRRGYSEVLKRRGFVYLLVAQALAVFDDNAFKQLVLLFVTARVISLATRNLVISLGTALYVLPYIVLSSYAGQVADRFSKRRVIIFMKILEASLLVLATIAMAVGQVAAMLAVLFLLGIHACFLDPAKEGILPQIFPDEDLSRANGLMQLTVYTMIVSGPVAAGLLLDAFLSKPYVPVSMLVGTALLGLVVARGISRVPAIAPGEKFRWNGFSEFWQDFRGNPRIARAFPNRPGHRLFLVSGRGLFAKRDRLRPRSFAFEQYRNQLPHGFGIDRHGLGAFVAGKLSGDQVELGLVPIGSVGLGVFGVFLFFGHHSFAQVFIGHFLLGFSGGIFIIPCNPTCRRTRGSTPRDGSSPPPTS